MRLLGKLLLLGAAVVAISLPFALRSTPISKPVTALKPRPTARQVPRGAKIEPPASAKLPELTAAQQRTVDEWMRRGHDWPSLASQETFQELHQRVFRELLYDKDWKHRLKQGAALARREQGDESATPENTAVVFDFEKIFANETDRLRYASALAAGDRKAVEDIYIDRMWAIATGQHFNTKAGEEGGLNSIFMTDEIREELRRQGR